jgi:hypothetical protein
MRKVISPFMGLLILASTLSPSVLWGQENLPTTLDKKYIPGAVRLQVTPRGMSYFETRLQGILNNLGVNLDEGYFESFEWKSDRSYGFDDINLPPEKAELLGKIRLLLSKWLVGFSLKEIRPGLQVGDTQYRAQFSRFALVTDEKLMRSLGKTDGAVLAIELEVKNMNIQTNRVRAFDLNNPFLGQVGADQVQVGLGSVEKPLRIRLPFYVKINSQGELEFQALQVASNLLETDLFVKYKKMVVPKIALEINGHRFEFNELELQKEAAALLPEILRVLKVQMDKFAREDLPRLLNEKAKQFFAGSLEEVQTMDPPGGESPNPNPLLWGLKASRIQLAESLLLDLSAYVEDPLTPNRALKSQLASRGAPTFTAVKSSDYDIAMSIDRGMINRVLQHSFERKLFENINMGEETNPQTCEVVAGKGSQPRFLRLSETPAIDYVVRGDAHLLPANQTFLKISTKVQVPEGTVRGLKKALLNDNFELNLNLIAKMKSLGPQGMQILFHDIDLESLKLDEEYLTPIGLLFKSSVLKAIREEMENTSRCWKVKENALPGTLPLPPEVLGLRLEVKKLGMDPRGHLVMYLNYIQNRVSGNGGVR